MNSGNEEIDRPNTEAIIDPSKCYIGRCPDEILTLIVEDLPTPCQCKVARISKTFSRISQEHFYRFVHCIESGKTLRFLRTVNMSHGIAEMVRSLYLNTGAYTIDLRMEDILQIPPDTQETSAPKSYNSGALFPFQESRIGGMILHLLPNLRYLHLVSWLYLPIRRLEFGDEAIIDLPESTAILNDTLQSICMACKDRIFEPKECLKRFAFIPGTFLRCPNLNQLELSVFGGRGPSRPGKLDTLLGLLSEYTTRLKVLKIFSDGDRDMSYLDVTGLATQLLQFTEVTVLSIPQNLLLGTEFASEQPNPARLLPPNIQKLEILDPRPDITRWLQDVASVGHMYSRLNETIINCCRRDNSFEENIYTSMVAVWPALRWTGFGVVFRYPGRQHDSDCWESGQYDPFTFSILVHMGI
ncbi:hypothetical protein K491DRAFT_674895 [Lophiostoma macrostomum CBS 122681]|uniref:F-box domain-containing protein n=1 Tax=Lophiostoma macrostomum CBS 122681 TaxID=1314788 RepID=A0A6A6TLS1_9PLEO|nr:hypothetical protein K491DRAFT_674895 [Lophiostoma macrostomum CBS 122681]